MSDEISFIPPEPGSPPQAQPLSPGVTPTAPLPGPRPGSWQPPAPEELEAQIPQYKILGLLGRGGMGAVYQGWQTSLERNVAVKILPQNLDDSDVNFAVRFKMEAKTMARLSHPCIVRVFDAGETAGGLLYFVMEFIQGTDVSQMLKAQKRLQPAHALAITAHVCDALTYAHEHGVIHRDIKPANIMLNMEGQVKVADFGLAKATTQETGGLTRASMTMGTPDFMAPEALITGMTVDHRADLYAVGVMLYYLLTGKVPRGIVEMPSKRVEGVDPRFDAIVLKAMKEEREQRYQSAREMRRDLDVILMTPTAKPQQRAPVREKPVMRGPGRTEAGLSSPARPGNAAGLESPASVKNPGNATILATLGALAALAVVAFFVLKPKAPDSPRSGGLQPPTKTSRDSGKNAASKDGAFAEAASAAVANAPLLGQALTPDQQKAAAVWRSRWGRPGKLRLVEDGKIRKPLSLAAAEPHSDFVQVVGGASTATLDGRWIALRSSGDVVQSDRKQTLTNIIAVVPGLGSALDICIRADGIPLSDGRPILERPVIQAKSGRLYGALNTTSADKSANVVALQDVNGSWQLIGDAFETGKLARPDLTNPPAVSDVLVHIYGIGVLRVDGTFQFFAQRELPVPPQVAAGVTAVFPAGKYWYVMKESGTGWKVTVSDDDKTTAPAITGGPTSSQRVLFSVWETRVQDYEVFAKETKHEWKNNPGFEQSPTHPAVGVSWEDATAFCAWLTDRQRKAGKLGANESYRLPSDHEWSCAVGIGEREDATKTPSAKSNKIAAAFPWGSTWPPPAGAGNYAGEETLGHEINKATQKLLTGYRDDFIATAPVGSFSPNRFGILDLSGNVWEWCEDWFDSPQEHRVFRGGYLTVSGSAPLLSSYRNHSGSRYRGDGSGGFRCVLSAASAH